MKDEITEQALMSLVTALQAADRQAIMMSRSFSRQRSPGVEEFWTHETIEGHRLWKLGGTGGTLLIGTNGNVWRKREMVASHLGSRESHVSPTWGCNCGVNAAKTYYDLTYAFHLGDPTRLKGQVTGIVDLSGIVHEYERGYRASNASIRELTLWVSDTSYWEDRKRYTKVDIREHGLWTKNVLAKHYKVPVKLEWL